VARLGQLKVVLASAVVGLVVSCSLPDLSSDDDDAAAADDDLANDDDLADDDSSSFCDAAAPCEGDYDIGNELDLSAIALCERITGSLQIISQSWLTGVDLPCTTSVGTLYLGHNDSLSSLTGLSSLTTVNSDVVVHYNACLSQADADAFSTTLAIGGSVSVHDNGSDYPCD